MKSDPEGLSVMRKIQEYADARKRGLSRSEAEQLLLDQQRHDNATLNDPMEDEDVSRTDS